MSFPIPVNMTVSESNIPVDFSVSENSVSYDMGIETEIVAGTTEEYEGPYSVTPTEQAQTLETKDKGMTDDVSIGAIPSDYVGSSIPRKSSADLTASNAKVTVPAGYYAESASKSIDSARLKSFANVTANPTITVSNSGMISASNSKSQNVYPVQYPGFADALDAVSINVSGSSTSQLSTQASTTITPTEQEQTAVAAQKYTVGMVKVGAIPSNYVGSGVTRNDSTDLSVSGATVTAPAGYYENAASASVPNATWKPSSTVGVVPEISVDSSGLITANCSGWTSIHPLTASGYADSNTAANIQLSGVKTSQLSTLGATTYTPSTVAQEIAAQQYLTGKQTIAAIPPQYIVPTGTKSITSNGTGIDVSQYASADVSVSPTLVKYAIRPDAEIIKSFTYDKMLVAGEGLTLPTYTTTATTLKASASLAGTVSVDLVNYDYYIVERMSCIPTYSVTSVGKGRVEFWVGATLYELVSVPPNTFCSLINPSLKITSRTNACFPQTASRLLYYSSGTAITAYNSAGYGTYQTVTAPTISGSTMTVKSPAFGIRGHTTYFTSTYFNALTDVRYQYVIDVYRTKKDTLNLAGWGTLQNHLQTLDCTLSSTGKLS